MLSIPGTHSEKLLRLYKRAKEPKLIRAYHLLYLSSKGRTVSELIDLFALDDETVRICIKKYLSHQELGDKERSGRPRRLTKEIVEELCRIVDENNPRGHGFFVSTWDCKELQGWLAQKKNVFVSQETIRKELVKNGFRCIKPGHDYALANKKQQAGFVSGFKRTVKANKAIILFSDESSYKLHPKQGYYWTREKKPLIKTHCSHKRIHTTGAVNPFTGNLVTRNSKKHNVKAFIKFLEKLLSKYKKKIILYLDRHPCHKAKKVQEFLKQKKHRIKIHWLPKYSPKYNLIEQLWNYTKKKRTNNKEFNNQSSLMKTLDHYYPTLAPEKIKQICSINCILKPG